MTKLKNRKIKNYKGKVFDLCVANSQTYNVENIAVHNSAGGCLVAYVLYITDLDPIKWNLPFSRFLSVYRKGAPDIDCVHEDHYVKMHDMSLKRIGDIVVGDKVVGGDGQSHVVFATYSRYLRYDERPLSIVVKSRAGVVGSLNVVPNHKFVLEDQTVVYAKDVKINDVLMSSAGVVVLNVVDSCCDVTKQYVDITVDDDHRFHVVPFNVIEHDDGTYELCNSYL